MVKKNIVLICLIFPFLHSEQEGQAYTTHTTDHFIQEGASINKETTNITDTTDTLSSIDDEDDDLQCVAYEEDEGLQYEASCCGQPTYSYDECAVDSKRDVIFQDDLLDLVKLDTTCREHIDRFNELNIVIKAVNEYHCPPGEKIEVTIQNNKWTIMIKNMTEDLLLQCIPIQDLLPQHKSKNRLEKYLHAALDYMTKLRIYIWGKTLAQYVKCTIVINGDIKPEEEHILCTDVIIDVVEWSQQKLLNISRCATGLLNTQITISKK